MVSAHDATIEDEPQSGTRGASATDTNANAAREGITRMVARVVAVIAGHALCSLPLFAAGGLRLGSCDDGGLVAQLWLAAHGMVEDTNRSAVCVLRAFFLCASEFSTDSCGAMLM